MVTLDEAKIILHQYLEKYNRESKTIGSNEDQMRRSLLEPLIRDLLGWNPDDPKEFIVESTQGRKRPDIWIYKEGIPQFVIEAKDLTSNIFDDEKAYSQVVKYAYYMGREFAILSNFHQFVILRADLKVDFIRQAEVTRFSLRNISDENLRLLLCFEKEEWNKNGEHNPILNKITNFQKKKPIDEKLLDDMQRWRQLLKNNIKSHPRLNPLDFSDKEEVAHIEEQIQKLINRLIFICFCEDKELHLVKLKNFILDKDHQGFGRPTFLLEKLQKLFREYDNDYDSDLFEKDTCDKFHIDDDKIYHILKDLRMPDKDFPPDFKLIPEDILGKAYENFIGLITNEKGKQKRKKEGIYYTPKYIVDYIVNNTVREYIQGKSFEEIKRVKILDPACGSGSFLLGAFDVLVQESEKSLGRLLSYEEKKELLLNCIFGVDIDSRAVKIAILSLSLKLAEKSKLPHLRQNIRHGNSLIDDKIVAGEYLAFRWEEEFKEIMDKGGFDIVVGNPPYVFAREKINDSDKEYYNTKYETTKYQVNTYVLFIEKGFKLLKHEGKLGFIVPDAWLRVESVGTLRKLLLENTHLEKIILIRGETFQNVGVESSIIIFEKTKKASLSKICKDIYRLNYEVISQSEWLNNVNFQIDLSSDNNLKALLAKLGNGAKTLDEVTDIKAGLQAYEMGKGKPKQTSADVKNRPYDYDYKFDKNTFKYLEGKDINRYSYKWSSSWLRYGEFLAAPRTFDLFSTPRLLVREIPSKPPYCIVSTYLEDIFLNNRSIINVLQKEKEINLKYILGVLNSKLMSFYHLHKSVKAQRDLFPKITLNDLRRFPIKIIPLNQQENIILLVNKNIYLQQEGGKKTINTSKVEEEIKKTDKEIDEWVYKLYGITDEEKKIIEENLK